MEPKITHVAIRFQGKVWSLPRPYRHHHIIRVIMYLDGQFGDGELTAVDTHGNDQGFLDEAGQYLTRKEAEARATLTGQIKNGKIIGGVLTSEDLW
jgi:hypothetical protein